MKQMKCEMCESTELMKEDGFFVCQGCGCKYSVEEAKKLMVEVEGGMSKKMENLYERARKSLEVDDLEHAAEYYKQILDEVPSDWEAYFYSYLGEMTSFTNAQAGSVAAKLGNTIPSAYDMAMKSGSAEEIAQRFQTITEQTVSRLVGIGLTGAALLRQYEGGDPFSAQGKVNRDMYSRMRDMAANTIANCVLALGELDEKLSGIAENGAELDEATLRESRLLIRRNRYDMARWKFNPTIATTETLISGALITSYAEKIKELDPEFRTPEEIAASNPSGSTTNQSGCGNIAGGVAIAILGVIGVLIYLAIKVAWWLL